MTLEGTGCPFGGLVVSSMRMTETDIDGEHLYCVMTGKCDGGVYVPPKPLRRLLAASSLFAVREDGFTPADAVDVLYGAGNWYHQSSACLIPAIWFWPHLKAEHQAVMYMRFAAPWAETTRAKRRCLVEALRLDYPAAAKEIERLNPEFMRHCDPRFAENPTE